jgi:hypothetical protein
MQKKNSTNRRREYPARTTSAVLCYAVLLLCRTVPHVRLTAKRSRWSRVAVILLLAPAYTFGRGLCARDSTRFNWVSISRRGVVIAGCAR